MGASAHELVGAGHGLGSGDEVMESGAAER